MAHDWRKVLVVEDNAPIRDGLVALFRADGWQVTAAATVAEGMAKLDGQSVALLDLQLPDGSGAALVREIRGRGLPTSIAVMSATARPEAAAELRGCPPDRFFPKPLDLDALIEWVDTRGPAAAAGSTGSPPSAG
jgi:DNA-binding response OmpR family regulator